MSVKRPRRPELRSVPVSIECRADGKAVYACIGDPSKALCGEAGVIAFGDNLPEALAALARELYAEVQAECPERTRAEAAEALLRAVVAAVRRSERANDMYRHGQGNDLNAAEIQQGAARAMQDALAEAEAHMEPTDA